MPSCFLTDSPDFIKLHLTHSHKTNTNLFLLYRGHDFMSVDFDSLKTAEKLNNPIRGVLLKLRCCVPAMGWLFYKSVVRLLLGTLLCGILLLEKSRRCPLV
ncbi:hypothetical protein SLA2020_502850 [Shorea laevis]